MLEPSRPNSHATMSETQLSCSASITFSADLLNNSLILHQLGPYLPLSSLLALGATCRTTRAILHSSPSTFRYLDLRPIRSASLPGLDEPVDRGGINWRSQRMDEHLTPDEMYAGPLRGILSKLSRRTSALSNISTLLLDGLSVPAELVQELLSPPRFRLRILSLREARFLNPRKLQQVLRYAVRPTRPHGTPTLRGLYIFGRIDSQAAVQNASSGARAGGRAVSSTQPAPVAHTGILSSPGAQIGAEWNERSHASLQSALAPACSDSWYNASGRVFAQTPDAEWAATMHACEGIIAFDAVLCRGPRHDLASTTPPLFLPPAMASVALGPAGCAGCGTSPEGPGIAGTSPQTNLPLLAPLPLHASTVAAAQVPALLTHTEGGGGRGVTAAGAACVPLYVRCEDCLRRRFCERCIRWWCEACYDDGTTAPAGAAVGANAQHGQGETAGAARYTQVSHFDEEALVRLAERDDRGGGGGGGSGGGVRGEIKVHLGLCTELCLVGEMMSGAGSFGMWG